jgi:hypothetical protein
VVRVNAITVRISPRLPERPALANDRLTDEVMPDAMVKLVAVPMVAPLAFTNETLPVQEAAVPEEDAVAVLVRSTRAVSVLPSPNGPELCVCVVVVVVVVWPQAAIETRKPRPSSIRFACIVYLM